ncbi:MAG: hypothetical protein HQK51_20795 [Oligoflexia bacterium]|nr:hypothetical protein [Oligoflexia bacterium]
MKEIISLLLEVLEFIKTQKKWWLLPILFVTIILGGLIILGQSSALSPFIYAVF